MSGNEPFPIRFTCTKIFIPLAFAFLVLLEGSALAKSTEAEEIASDGGAATYVPPGTPLDAIGGVMPPPRTISTPLPAPVTEPRPKKPKPKEVEFEIKKEPVLRTFFEKLIPAPFKKAEPALPVLSREPELALEEKKVLKEEMPKAPEAPAPAAAVVTATRLEQPLETISSSATVITKEDIERQKAQTVLEVLRNVPGLHLNKLGGPGRGTTVFLRGGNANQTLVLIDGVQVNSPTSGDFDFSKLTTENIERIEVIRGPQSTLYGSNAMAGVINIITQRGAAGMKPHLNSWFEFGTLESLYEGQDFAAGWKNASLTGSWSRWDTVGLGENDQFEDTNVTTNVKVDLAEDWSADFLYRYSNGLVGIDDGAFRNDPNRISKSRNNILSSTLKGRPTEWWEQKLKPSFFHDVVFSFDPRDPGTTQTESRFKLDADIYAIDWQHDFFLGDHDTFTLGYEFEYATANNKTFNKLIRNHGWYLQNLLEMWERVYLTAGIRFEQNSAFGFDSNPKVGLAYLHRETDTKLKANVGTAFRAPTLNELFFPNFGDPTLQPEESIGFDLGLEQKLFSNKVFAGATYFYNYYEDLIVAARRPELGNLLRATNVGKTRTGGVELEAVVRPFKQFEAKVFYTFLQAETIARREPLVRRPKHSGGFNFDWRLFERLSWNVNMTVVGDRYDTSFAAGRPPREIIPPFAKIDTTLSYDITRHFQFYLRFENINHDDDYEVIGFDAPGTQFFGGVKVKLG